MKRFVEGGDCTQVSPLPARSMSSQAKGTGVVGYNAQAVVDAKRHLIAAHEVTNVGCDQSQPTKMANAAQEAMDKQRLQVLADCGYFNGPEIKACMEAGVIPLVPKPMTSGAKAEGRFSKADFIYIAKEDVYRRPAGQLARYRMTTVERGPTLHRYRTSACPKCPQKSDCTPSDYRRITRWEHEAVLEVMQRRVALLWHAHTSDQRMPGYGTNRYPTPTSVTR